MSYIQNLASRSKALSPQLAILDSTTKNEALTAISQALLINQENICKANASDYDSAQSKGISEGLLDRLQLTPERLQAIAQSVLDVAALKDPVGKILSGHTLPNGIEVIQKTVPFGVIGTIYESRPNVTVDMAALCLKSGNACLLRGSKDAISSNKKLVEVMREALIPWGLQDAILLVEDLSHEVADEMMRLNGYLDLLIPRGSGRLISRVVENATVPVIETGTGNCHLYVEKSADLDMALSILENGKTTRLGVCNALESLLVDEAIAHSFLPMAFHCLEKHQIEMRGCEKTRSILPKVLPATEEDYAAEFLDRILSVKVVENIGEAILHIARYSTHHSDAIVTNSIAASNRFTNEVDSAAVYVNASTRFTDGGEFGFGSEIGISTQKLHVRGPMGLEHLVSYKYVLHGNGQIR